LTSTFEAGKVITDEDSALVQQTSARIRALADDLLLRRDARHSVPVEHLSEQWWPLAVQLSALVTEKMAQYRHLVGIKWNRIFDASEAVYLQYPRSQFDRVLSNLIDNAVEATTEGQISILLKVERSEAIVEINDTGRGVEAAHLPKLGEKGFSTGKVGGSGLGLYSAKSAVNSWGGNLEIESKLNLGTRVRLRLKAQETPLCFAKELNLVGVQRLIVVDDDSLVHKLWLRKFREFPRVELDMVFLKSISELLDLVAKGELRFTDRILMDFEFRNSQEDGLSVLARLNLTKVAYLVTGNFGDQVIQGRCQRLAVSLLSKSMIEFIPIRR
jgi:hypothetical protein